MDRSDDVQVAIVVEVRDRLAPAVIEVVYGLLAEVGRRHLGLTHLQAEVAYGDVLKFDFAGSPHIER